HQIVKLFLYHRPCNRCVWQSFLQRRPMPAVIERVIETVPRSGEEQSFAVGVLRNITVVSQRMLRKPIADLGPCLRELCGAVNEGIAIVRQMKVNGAISRTRVEVRRFDTGDTSPTRQAGDILG